MGKLTDKLKMFLYDKNSDKEEPFDLEKGINENFEKIDIEAQNIDKYMNSLDSSIKNGFKYKTLISASSDSSKYAVFRIANFFGSNPTSPIFIEGFTTVDSNTTITSAIYGNIGIKRLSLLALQNKTVAYRYFGEDYKENLSYLYYENNDLLIVFNKPNSFGANYHRLNIYTDISYSVTSTNSVTSTTLSTYTLLETLKNNFVDWTVTGESNKLIKTGTNGEVILKGDKVKEFDVQNSKGETVFSIDTINNLLLGLAAEKKENSISKNNGILSWNNSDWEWLQNVENMSFATKEGFSYKNINAFSIETNAYGGLRIANFFSDPSHFRMKGVIKSTDFNPSLNSTNVGTFDLIVKGKTDKTILHKYFEMSHYENNFGFYYDENDLLILGNKNNPYSTVRINYEFYSDKKYVITNYNYTDSIKISDYTLISNLKNMYNSLIAGKNASEIRNVLNVEDGANKIPVGFKGTTTGKTIPIGWLKANGALLSRTTYPALWAFAQASGNIVDETTWANSSCGSYSTGDGSTTFRIPDLRGYFERNWDDGRGVDSGRKIGSSQADDIKSHAHTATSTVAGEHTHTYSTRSSAGGTTGGSDAGGSGYNYNTTSLAGAHNHIITVNSTGGTETRGKNIALMAIIKY